MANGFQNADDLDALKKQLNELQQKLDRANKVTSALISGEHEEHLIYKWKAPTRLYIKRDKQWLWTMVLVFLIACVALLYMREYVLILVALALMFLVYVSSLVPPVSTEHQITSLGIRTFGELYTWDMLKDFWISYKNGREILNVDTNVNSPTRLILLFSTQDKAKIVRALKEKLKYYELDSKQGFIQRTADGLYMPLADVEATMVGNIQ